MMAKVSFSQIPQGTSWCKVTYSQLLVHQQIGLIQCLLLSSTLFGKKKNLPSCYFKERTTGMHMYLFPRLKHKAEASSQEHL